MEKVKVNLIYAPQGCDSVAPRFENEFGELWMNMNHKSNMYNISMSFYSANYPNPRMPGDSIYVIEPICVSSRDYELFFLSNFKYIFTWATEAFKNTAVEKNIIPLNHPSCWQVDAQGYENRKKGWSSWNDRRDEITFIANNKISTHTSQLYGVRKTLAQWLNNNSKKHRVTWYAQETVPEVYFRGHIREKSEVLNKVKFSICTENCYDRVFSTNYFTEKMPEVWFSGAVPIYMGCYNIDDFGFHPDSYIDLRKFRDGRNNIRLKELLDEINSFTEEKYNKYLEAVDYNIYKAGLFDKISDDKVMAKMIETFWKEKNGI